MSESQGTLSRVLPGRRRRSGRGRGAVQAKPYDPSSPDLVHLTSVIDNRDHVVTDVELTSPHAMRMGRYEALCGHLIAPAPLVDPEGLRCKRCRDLEAALNGPEPT